MNIAHLAGLYRGERIDAMTVCHLTLDIANAIGANVTRVFLSRDTMDKQKVRHPELTEMEYQLLRPILNYGEYRLESKGRAIVIFTDTRLTSHNYRAHLKAPNHGREIFVDSLCRLGDRQHRSELRRPYPVIREHLRL